MVVTCDHCGARYRFDDERISGRGARITCPRCKHVFLVHKDEEEPVPVEELPPLDVHSLDFSAVGIRSWKVKVAIGLVYDFSDYKTLRKYIKEGRVTEADHLSYDNESWVEIGSLSDLKQYFIDIYREAQQAQAALEAAEEAAAQAAAHPSQEEAEAIADALLDAVEADDEVLDAELDVEVEVENGDEAEEDEAPDEEEPEAPEAAPEAAPEEDDRSADEIGDDLLAAMEEAVAAEAGGIDLDMDALLEKNKEEQEEAPAPRRNLESAALAQVQATGNADAQTHKFVDPFEALKQTRKARTKGRSSSRKKSKKANKKEEGSNRKQKVLLVAGLLAVLGYLVMDNMAQQEPPPDPSVARAAASKAQTEREAKRGEALRQKMQAKLTAELKNVQEDDIEAFKVEDEQLIPVGPGSKSKGRRAGMPPGYASGQGAPGLGGGAGSEDHLSNGKAAASRGQWSKAAVAFSKALKLDPANADLRTRRGRALYRSGRHDEAEGELRRAASGGSITAHKVLGHMAAELGDNSGAVAHYQTYLRSGPRDKAAIEKIIQKLTN